MDSFGLHSDIRVELNVKSQRTKNVSYQSFFKFRTVNNNVISLLFTWHLPGCMANTVSNFVSPDTRMLTNRKSEAKGHQDVWGGGRGGGGGVQG